MRIPLVAVATGAAVLSLAVAPSAVALGEVGTTARYTCSTPSGDVHPAVRYSVGQPPATMVAGQTVGLPTTATLALDAAATGLVGAQGATSVSGTVRTAPTASRVGLDLVVAPTPLGNGANGVTNAPLSGTTLLRASTAGAYVVRTGSLGDVALTGRDAADQAAGSVEFPTAGSLGTCTDDAGASTLTGIADAVATVKVVKDTTATTLTAAFAPARGQATGRARVRSHFGLRPTGTVAFTLRRGTHAVATIRRAVDRRGVARATFAHVTRRGGYSIVGRYAGDAALDGSRGTDSFRVGA